jgi:hypothetical protein
LFKNAPNNILKSLGFVPMPDHDKKVGVISPSRVLYFKIPSIKHDKKDIHYARNSSDHKIKALRSLEKGKLIKLTYTKKYNSTNGMTTFHCRIYSTSYEEGRMTGYIILA